MAVAPDTFQGQSTLWPFRAIFLGYQYAFRQGATWGVPDLHAVVQWWAGGARAGWAGEPAYLPSCAEHRSACMDLWCRRSVRVGMCHM